MSEPTGPAASGRPPVVPIVLGLLLVVAVIAAALWVERATDDDLGLPDQLSGGYAATDVAGNSPGDAASAERFADQQRKLLDSAEDRLADVLDADVTIRGYQASAAERQVTITVLDADAGPFAPSGPQADPGLLGMERGPTELVREGDVVCQVAWVQPVTKGEELPDDDPAAVHCQLGADGHTYWLNGRGLTAADAAEILEDLAD